MIKIKGQFENGAQMRQELLALLGMNGAQPVVTAAPVAPQPEALPATSGPVDPEPAVEEKPKVSKRRTKAELEAEALKANTGTEEPPASEVNVETTEVSVEQTVPAVEETAPAAEKPKYTLDDAKLAAAKLSRTGPEFRNKAKDIAFKYAQMTNPGVDKDAALVPKIAPEHYEAFIAEIEEAGK